MTLQQIAASLAQIAQDLLAYANTIQPVTYEGEYTATVTKSYTKDCASGNGSEVSYTKSSTQKKSSNVSVADAIAQAKVAAEVEALRLVEAGGQANANLLGNCIESSEIINPTPVYFIPSKPWLVKTEIVGIVQDNILWKITDNDGHSRNYLNVGSNFNSVGRNIISRPDFKLKTGITKEYILLNNVDVETSNGGLAPDNNAFKFSSNEAVIPGEENITPIEDLPKTEWGAIFWDNWERDYWDDPNASEDDLNRNHIGSNRVAATEWKHLFNLVPFYGKHTEPELINIRYNVRVNPTTGRNDYDTAQRHVTVKYDRTTADRDRELKYYADAGFSWICFNYYSDISYLSTTRRHFVQTTNKYGLKMTFMIQNDREDSEVNYIADLMTKDFWFKIDGKPVLYLGSSSFEKGEAARYKNAYKDLTGGDLYLVYYAFGGVPTDWNDLLEKRSKGAVAVSAYSQTSSIKTAEALIEAEINSRKNFINSYGHTFQLIPNLTTGLEELGLRSSLTNPNRAPGVPACNIQQLARKCEYFVEDVKKYNVDKINIPAVLWYAGNEILESGNPLVPTLNLDNSINTDNLDTISRYIKR